MRSVNSVEDFGVGISTTNQLQLRQTVQARTTFGAAIHRVNQLELKLWAPHAPPRTPTHQSRLDDAREGNFKSLKLKKKKKTYL